MSSLIEFPLETNGEALVESAFAFLEGQFPGWKPKPGNAEDFLIRGIVYAIILPLAELVVDVPPEIFNYWGEKIVGVQPHLATAASVITTWVVSDEGGRTIEAGTQVDIAVSGNVSKPFRVATDVVIPAGETSTGVGEVLLEAVEPGAASSGLGEAGSEGDLVDAFGWVSSITLVEPTHGGVDAEEPTAYLARLAETMKTLSPRPVIARDVEILARNIAGVGRSTAIDNYNAETEEDEQEKTVSLFIADATGRPCSTPVKGAVKADLQSKREANFIFIVEDPTYTKILVKATIVERAGFDHAAVVEAVEVAVREFLDPSLWGSGFQGDPTVWVNTPTLRFQDLVTVINNVQGVDYYSELKVKKTGGSYGTADVALNGPAPLPEVETLEIS